MRVALADDSALFRDGLAMLLGSAGIDVVVQARDGDSLMSELAVLPPDSVPDVAILDIRMPPTFTDEGLRTAAALRRTYPAVGILVLSTYAETAYAAQVLDIGERATGYLLKDRVGDTGVLLDAWTASTAGRP